MDYQALDANYVPGSTTQKQTPKKKGRGGFLSSLIAEGGATGGAVGGAAAGTAVLPGIGTVIGAGLGGLLGGLGGSAAEQKVRDDEVDWKKAAGEGLLSGATSLVVPGGAGTLVKGGLKKGAQAAAEDVTEQVAKSGTKSIPVKFIPSEMAGKGVQQTNKNTLTNATISDLTDAIGSMQSNGYKVSQRLGATKGSKLPSGIGVAPDFTPLSQSPRLSTVELTGNKTGVKFGNSTQQTTQVIEGTGLPQARAAAIQRGKKVAGIEETAKPVTANTGQTPELPSKRGLLAKFSSNATKSGSGLKVGNNVGDVNKIDQATDVLQKYGIAGTPTKQLRKVDETMGSLGKQVDDILAKNPIQLDGTAVRTQVQQAIDDPLKYAELDLTTPGAMKTLEAHLTKFSGAKTAKEVNDYVKTLNPIARRAQEKIARGAAITDKESAALAAKKAGDEVLSQFPEIKPLKTDMAVLFERNPEISKLSEQKAGIPILGIQSRGAKQALAGVQSKAGQLTSGANKPQQDAGLLGKFKKAGAAQLAASGAMNLSDMGAELQVQDDASLKAPQLGQGMDIPQIPTEEAYSQQNMLADIQRDPENANTYLKLYESLAAQNPTQKPLSAEASKVIATANSGLSSLDMLGGLIQQGGVPAGTVVPGRGLLGGLGQSVLGTSAFDAAADNVADAMVRARTGAAATKDELALYRRLLPQAADPPEVQQQKMDTVRNYFMSIANRTGSAGSDMQAAVGV